MIVVVIVVTVTVTITATVQTAMREASLEVLDGFSLRSDAEIVRYPDRYMDPRGVKMWETVTGLLAQREVVTW